MILHTRRRPSAAVRITTAAVAALSTATEAVARFIAAEIDRRRTAALLGFDDHMLRDIGITRADVHASLLTPAGEKPSDRLARSRREQRTGAEAQVAEARSALRADDVGR